MYRMAQWISRICLMCIVCWSFRGDTGEDQGAIQVRNQYENSGPTSSWFRRAGSWVVDKCRPRNHPVLQCSYIDGDPNVTSYEVIYRSVIERTSLTPYRIKFHDPAHIITGIVCQPKDAKTSSPEVKVISGGVGYKEVEIELTPVQEGNWCCCVQMNGIAENRLEMNSIPNQLNM